MPKSPFSLPNLPKLRFKGFDGEWEEKKLSEICIDVDESIFINSHDIKVFLDAPAIMKKEYSIYNMQRCIVAPEKSIVFIKDGSNAGNFFYNEKKSFIASTCQWILTNINNQFIYFLLEKNKEYICRNLIIGETIPHLYKSTLQKFNIFVPSILEQQKIAKFFSLLDKQIELWETKLKLNEQFKKYTLNRFFKKNDNLEFYLKDITIESNKKINYKDIELGVVGKYGIKRKIDVFKSSLNVKNDHICKILKKNNLVIGMGTNQIDSFINLNFDSLGVSVAYKIFELNENAINFFYLDNLLKFHNKKLSSLYMVISARQGKNVDINSLFNYKFLIHTLSNQNYFSKQIMIIDNLIKSIKCKIILLKKNREYFLKNVML